MQSVITINLLTFVISFAFFGFLCLQMYVPQELDAKGMDVWDLSVGQCPFFTDERSLVNFLSLCLFLSITYFYICIII